MKISAEVFRTNAGWCGVGWSDRGIAVLVLPEMKRPRAEKESLAAAIKRFPACRVTVRHGEIPAAWKKQITLYFRGRKHDFSKLPLDLSGATVFQKKVWRETVRIPPGKTLTYGALAAGMGCPRSARAAGQALGKNPVPVIIPCHRVVSSRGLGGFTAGLAWKKKLLGLEGCE